MKKFKVGDVIDFINNENVVYSFKDRNTAVGIIYEIKNKIFKEYQIMVYDEYFFDRFFYSFDYSQIKNSNVLIKGANQ